MSANTRSRNGHVRAKVIDSSVFATLSDDTKIIVFRFSSQEIAYNHMHYFCSFIFRNFEEGDEIGQ